MNMQDALDDIVNGGSSQVRSDALSIIAVHLQYQQTETQRINEQLAHVLASLNGNGKKGLRQRIERLEWIVFTIGAIAAYLLGSKIELLKLFTP